MFVKTDVDDLVSCNYNQIFSFRFQMGNRLPYKCWDFTIFGCIYIDHVWFFCPLKVSLISHLLFYFAFIGSTISRRFLYLVSNSYPIACFYLELQFKEFFVHLPSTKFLENLIVCILWSSTFFPKHYFAHFSIPMPICKVFFFLQFSKFW